MNTMDQLKRNAKRIAKEKGISHCQALDIIAIQLGYKNWSLFHKAAQKSIQAQEKKQGSGV